MATLESLENKIEVLIGGLDKKIDALDMKFEDKINGLDAKFDTKIDALDKKIDDKIDELAAMTARGFLELRGEFKNDIHEVVEKLEVIEENYVTKDDFVKFGRNMDLMLDKHIGTFRKDTDELAKRTKNIEKVVFATS